jgi:hypothetical protein
VRSILAILVAVALMLPGGTRAQTSPRVIRVLFIGNSYTHFHQMPHLVRRIIASAEPDAVVHTQAVTHSGWDLWRHWRAGIARRRLVPSAHYTHVVLQGHSLAPLHDRERRHMTEAADRFAALSERAGARTILFETWARQSGNVVYRHGDPASPADMQASIDAAYHAIAADTGATVAPVGDTFRRVATLLPEDDLYGRDGSHPSELGTFVAAATLATQIAGIDPMTITYRPIEISPSEFDTVREALRATH